MFFRLATFLAAIFVSACFTPTFAQEKIKIDENTTRLVDSPWQLQTLKTKASLRGLHVLTSKNVWASGTNGTVVNTYNGGQNWRELRIKGAEELDVRDIHAIDDATVIAMTSGTPATIFRTTNAGLSWKKVLETKNEKVFFDAMDFWDDMNGVIMSDPIDNKLIILKTTDGGLSWKQVTSAPRVQPGEAGFAASGSNMITMGTKKVLVGLGSGTTEHQTNERSRVVFSDDNMRTWKSAVVPLPRFASAGVFSLGFANNDDGVAVGGDYKQPESTQGNFAITSDGGASWSVPADRKPPSGFRSCVSAWMKGKEINFVTVGTNGTDMSTDLGKSWVRVSNEGFHAIEFSNDMKTGWACGVDGRVAKWVMKVEPKKK